MADNALHKWIVAGVAAAAAIVLMVPLYVIKERRATSQPPPSGYAAFVGRAACVECHAAAADAWAGSDHDRAMDVATDSTVLGNFNDAVFRDGELTARFSRRDGRFLVTTAGPDGTTADFEVTHVFGCDPLQQYLIPFPGGRLQSLTIAWDVREQRWFSLYPGQDIPPDDWLHWTRGAQTWNAMCAECHSTNLVKGYDPDTDTYATTWSEIDVSCEACHGPASRHVEWARKPDMARPDLPGFGLVVRTRNLSSREQVDLCGPCHSRRTELGDYDHTTVEFLDRQLPSVLEPGLYFADGQIQDEVYVYGSFLQSKMHRNNVRCSDCHDPHSLQLRHEGNALCTQCHRADTYDSYDHHFHKREHEGKPSDGHLCVKCHMPERAYMVIDWRADHSIRAPRPDLSVEIGTPNACNQAGCHADQTVEWAAEHFRDWYGRARKPHYGTILAAARAGEPGAAADLVQLSGDTLYPGIVRATALSLLGSFAGPDSDAGFERALADPDPLVRYTAVSNAALRDRMSMVDLLAPLLFDPVRAVRMEAAVRLAPVPATELEDYQVAARDSALAEYESAMRYSLDFAFAGHNLGNLYASIGQPATAARYYENAVEVDDRFYPAKVNLAVLYSSMGRNGEAERLLREVVDSEPELHDVSYSLGLLLAETGKTAEAERYLARAARGMPGNARVHYNHGLLLQQLGRGAEAREELETALRLAPENIDFLHALADHHLRAGRSAEALDIVERMINLYPEARIGYEMKAVIERSSPAPLD